jgi:hypothetical protein
MQSQWIGAHWRSHRRSESALVGDFLWAWLSPYLLSRKSIVGDSMGLSSKVLRRAHASAKRKA